MKTIVFGGKGMLGTAVKRTFTEHGIDAVALGRNEADITKKEEVERIVSFYKPEMVINCAAYTFVDDCEKNRELAFRVNGEGAGNVGEEADKGGSPVVYISTDYVFDGKKGSPYTEEDRTYPINVYGESKLKGEELTIKYADKHYIIRTAWLFGENGRNFVDTMRGMLAKGTKPLKVVNDQRGSPTFTNHFAEALVKIAKNIKGDAPAPPGVYHVTANGDCTWYDLAVKTAELMSAKTEIIPVSSEEFEREAKRPAYSVLDNERAGKLLGLEMPSWENGLREYVLGR
ncbi:MAG: dTDP-4-dehydrorhamnose reductase [bacterium]